MSRRTHLKPPDENDDEIIIFLHIPKAGGVTFSKILERQFSPAETLTLEDRERQIAQFKTLPAAQRGQYRLIQGHQFFGLHRSVPRASTYITFLRRPVERVLSFYRYARSTPDHYLYPLLTSERLDLKTLLARDVTLELRNEQTRLIAGDGWTDPQRVVTPAALEEAKVNLRTHFRVVGLLEEFDASLLLLQRAFGWHLPFYVKENVTKAKPDGLSPDTETRRLIEEANSLDSELYEYACDLFEEQRRAAGDSFDAELRHFRRLNRVHASLGKFHAHSLARFISLFRMPTKQKLSAE